MKIYMYIEHPDISEEQATACGDGIGGREKGERRGETGGGEERTAREK